MVTGRTAVVFLALFALVAQCHVLKNKEPEPKKPEHSREKRSCHECDFGYGPQFPPPPPPDFGLPPPPPPYFRTQNWSGFSRHADGSPHTVFSGASAAANTQATGTAYSAASSSVGAGSGGQSIGFGGQSDHGVHFASNTQGQRNGGQNSIGYNPSGSHDAYTSNHRQVDHDNEGLAGPRYHVQKKYFGAGDDGFGNNAANSAQLSSGSGFGNEQQQVQSIDSGFGNWHGHNHGPEKYQDEQQVQSSGSGQWEQGGYGSGSHFGNSQSGASSASNGGLEEAIGAGATQEAFKGALNLASQGLQTSQQNGCSTCGKGSYALSNAKSNSGNAIALSIGK